MLNEIFSKIDGVQNKFNLQTSNKSKQEMGKIATEPDVKGSKFALLCNWFNCKKSHYIHLLSF